MNDSADIKSAKAALDNSVDLLEGSVAKLLSRMKTLEAGANDSEAFRADRAKLAEQLDEMAAQAEAAQNKLASREADFTKLTRDSEAELDQIMNVVRGALERSLGA